MELIVMEDRIYGGINYEFVKQIAAPAPLWVRHSSRDYKYFPPFSAGYCPFGFD